MYLLFIEFPAMFSARYALVLQNTVLFVEDSSSSIILAPFVVMTARVFLWPLALFMLLLFPWMVARYEENAGNEKTLAYTVIWKVWVAMYFLAFLLADSGPRIFDFNFAWGIILANGLVYVVAFHMWYNSMQTHIRDNGPLIRKNPTLSEKNAMKYYVGRGVWMAYLLIVGLVYFALLSCGISFGLL